MSNTVAAWSRSLRPLNLMPVEYYPPGNMIDSEQENRSCSSKVVSQFMEEIQIDKIIDILALGKQIKEHKSVGVLRRISS
jgi:hypothetical protein